jgi:hypothetical protein
MMKNWNKYIVSLTLVGVIELVTYFLLPKARADIWNHQASYSSYIPFLYYLILLLSIVSFFIYLFKNTSNKLTIPLFLIFLAIVHTTYLMWSLNCSCGDP